MSNEATLLFQQCADILKILQTTFPVQHDLRLQCVVLIFPNHFGRLWRAPAQCNELVQWSNPQPESQLEPYSIILGATKAGHFVKLVMFRRLQTKPKVPLPNGPFPTNAYLCIGSRVASRQCRLLWISIWYPEKWMTVPIGSMYAIYGNIYHQYTSTMDIWGKDVICFPCDTRGVFQRTIPGSATKVLVFEFRLVWPQVGSLKWWLL